MTWSKLFQIRLLSPWLVRLLLLLGLMIWLSGCATNSPQPSAALAAVSPPVMPALPSNARQPSRSSICLPNCIENLIVRRENSLKKLSDTGLQE